MWRTIRSLCVSALACACLLGCFGRHDECGEDDERCEEGHIATCGYTSQGYRYHRTTFTCGSHSPPPPPPPMTDDPRCVWQGDYCDGNVLVKCAPEAGFAFERYDCAGEASPRTCVIDSFDLAFCAVSSEVETVCSVDNGFGAVCQNGTLTECRNFFIEEITVCPGACVALDWHRPFCALSSTPDSSCEGTGRDRERCYEQWTVQCIGGYAALDFDCGEERCAISSGELAFCE